MKQVIITERVPIKLWLDDAEEGAIIQAKNIANLPFVFKHVSIMGDSHQGYGAPIGGVAATHNVIVPNFVGKDIACGMSAVQTSLTEIDIAVLKKIMGRIRQLIPLGMNRHKTPQDEKLMPKLEDYKLDYISNKKSIVEQEYTKSTLQLGTLGGG